MVEKPQFSIVIIYYNSEKYVKASIESILNQTYDDWELILVNDGSFDNTEKICEEYSKNDSRIKLICKENGGIASARNVGICNSRGEYVLLIDGDDYVSSNMLESFYELIEESEHSADYIFGKMNYFDDETGTVYRTQHNFDVDLVKGLNGRDAFVKFVNEQGRVSMGVRGAFRLEFLKKYKIKFENRYYEDVNVIMKVLLNAQYVMVNTNAVYFFRDRRDSTSKRVSFNHFDDIFLELDWWMGQIGSLSEDDIFYISVRKEICRRTKAAIRKYVRQLSVKDMKKMLPVICNHQNFFYPNISGIWIMCKHKVGLFLLRYLEIILSNARKLLLEHY